MWIERVRLKDHGDITLTGVAVADFLPIEDDLARIWAVKARHESQGG